MSYTEQYLAETGKILDQIEVAAIDRMVNEMVELRRRGGRLFVLGCGGGAGHASHAVNDFRKIAGIEAYTPTDNVSELTARINDDGWETCYVNWLKGSKLNRRDMLLVLSVGGGNREHKVSMNIVRCLEYARVMGCTICGVVGRDGGYTAQVADACVVVPTINANTVTPHVESFQAVIWHLLASHPFLQTAAMKWESLSGKRRAVFLDRDGVLNRAYLGPDGVSHPPAAPEEVEILDGVAEACQALREAGFLLIGVTNQPDVARGTQMQEVVEAINDVLRCQALIDEILVCYHDDPDNCACRKPKPGLLLDAASNWDIDYPNSFMVGDRWKDIEAGRRAGCKTVLVNGSSGENGDIQPDFQADSLLEAARWILAQNRQSAAQ
jgi:D-sedoheptulose 7-phosphate isomerase